MVSAGSRVRYSSVALPSEIAPRAKTSCIRVSRPECSASAIFRAFSIDRNTDAVREKSASASRLAERALKRWFARARKRRSNICRSVPVRGMVSKTGPLMSRKCSLKVYNRLTPARITNTRYEIGYRGLQSDAQLLKSVSVFGPPDKLCEVTSRKLQARGSVNH